MSSTRSITARNRCTAFHRCEFLMLWRKAIESDEHDRGQLSAEFLRQNLIGMCEPTRSLPPRQAGKPDDARNTQPRGRILRTMTRRSAPSVFSRLRPQDFHYWRLTFQPERQVEWLHFVPPFSTGDFTLARAGNLALPTPRGAE
jgi:hypothetical protein